MGKPIKPIQNNAECERILSNSYTGSLVMCNDENPYAVPINHSYYSGKLYFHCATEGRKLEMIRENPKVCYMANSYFGDPVNYKKGMVCHGEWESVIAYGNARVLEEPAEICKAFVKFMKHYGSDDYEPSEESLETTTAIVIDIESMTARREPARYQVEYWYWSPSG